MKILPFLFYILFLFFFKFLLKKKMGNYISAQKVKQKTDQLIEATIQVSQESALSSVATTNCLNEINLNGCDLRNVKVTQKCMSKADAEGFQKAVTAQADTNTLTNELFNQIEQKTQNLTFNVGNQSAQTLNNLAINMASEIVQNHITSCVANLNGSNIIQCSGGGTMDTVVFDQSQELNGAVKCTQDSMQTSKSYQDIVNKIQNLNKQSVENSIWACAVCIGVIVLGVVAFFGLPVVVGGSTTAAFAKAPMGVMLVTFCCILSYATCYAMNESDAYLIQLGGLRVPPKINDRGWNIIGGVLCVMFIAAFIVSIVMLKNQPDTKTNLVTRK